MCGLAGMISIEKKEIDAVVVYRMLEKIRHRGPDDRGFYALKMDGEGTSALEYQDIVDKCFLIAGFNRLSIQDLSINGHQPMISSDGMISLMFNGEIYNTAQLKEKLADKGIETFKSKSDTEVILKTYEAFGCDAFRMLNGMYAIAIVDLIKKKLLLVRDKFGIIPLHIAQTQKHIIWASEIKCFLEIEDFKREIDLVGLSRGYLYCNTYNFPYSELLYLDPGNYMEIDLNKPCNVKIFKYFSINEYFNNINNSLDIDEAEERFSFLLRDCVRRQLISDVPLGLQFSGGIDSSLIAYCASELYQNNRCFKTYSMLNPINTELDESTWIKLALDKIFADPYFSYLDENLFLKNYEQTLYAYEKFLGVQNGIGIYEFSGKASKEVTVLLSGEGADEICGGYGFGSLAYNENFQFDDEFLLGYDRQIKYYENGMKMIDKFDLGEIVEERRNYLATIDGSKYQKIVALWLKEEIINLLERQNKITMAHSVENRVPYLDDKMVEFLVTLPLECVEKRIESVYESKYILKRYCEKIFGSEFAYRKKQGFGMCLSTQMLTDGFQKYLQTMIIPQMKRRGIINMKEFNEKYERMNTGQEILSVWKAINIETWMQFFIDGREPLSCEEAMGFL